MSDDATAPAELPSRSDLRMVERAIVQRWAIPVAAFDKLPGVLVALIADASKSDRDRLRAASVLVTMDRANLDRETQADKVARLDDGNATERVEFAPIVIGRVERVGQPLPLPLAPTEPSGDTPPNAS